MIYSVLKNGIGWNDTFEDDTVHDDYRIDYMRANIQSMKDAVDIDGIPLMGYLYWGCVDMVSNGEGEMARDMVRSTLMPITMDRAQWKESARILTTGIRSVSRVMGGRFEVMKERDIV